MSKQSKALTRSVRHKSAVYLGRAFGGLALIVVHELGAVTGHLADLRVRVATARRAHGIGELVRDQVDLVSETRVRLKYNHRVRVDLLRSLLRELRLGLRAA